MTENCAATSVLFYTVPEAATLLEWSEDRVWMALETGQLPAIAPAYWGSPELFEYRFAPPRVVLAIRAAGSDEVTWEDTGPVGPARFPADPSKIRLLAEYVDALLGLSSGIEPAASGVRCAEVRGAPGVSKQPAGTAAESAPEGAHQEAHHQPRDCEQELADLFDPVGKAQLEAMFPAGGKWAQYANYAPRNKLIAARVAHGKFNPYLAAKWWIDAQEPVGWTWERCLRKLANNLPSRSRDLKHLLTDNFD